MRERERERERQTDRQTDRQREREREKEKEKEREIYHPTVKLRLIPSNRLETWPQPRWS